MLFVGTHFLSPRELIFFQEDIAHLICSFVDAEKFKWTIGGMDINNASLRDLEVIMGTNRSVLSFRVEERLNRSTINCTVHYNENKQVTSSSNTIKVQGEFLSSVP